LSFIAYLARAGPAVVGGRGGGAGGSADLVHSPSTLLSFALSLLALAPAGALVRIRSLRSLAWGWIGAVSVMMTAALVLYALDALT
jgi:hypothetical protein